MISARAGIGSAVSRPRRRREGADAPRVAARRWPLRVYFVFLISLFVVAAGSAAIYVALQADHDARVAAQRDASFAAKTAASQLSDYVRASRGAVAQLAANPQIAQVLTNPKGCTLSFTGIGGHDTSHLDIVRADGSVACSSRLPAKGDGRAPYAHSTWLTRAKRGPIFVAPATDAETKGPAVISARPIAHGRAVVVAFGDLAAIGPKLVELYGGGRKVEFLVTSRNGNVVVARSIRPQRWIGLKLESTNFAKERTDLNGTRRFYASAPVPGLPWRFSVGEDKAAALATESRLERRQLLIVLIGLLAFVFGAFAIYRSVATPLRRFSAAVRASSGLAQPTPVTAEGPLEIAALAEDVNSLIGSVKHELGERERAEEQLAQLQKMEAIGQLAGGVAHDFNNLLTAITGYGDLARRRSTDPELTANLDAVLSAAERAGQLTHQLLAFSRRQMLQVRPLDLNEIVADTEKLLRRLIGEHIRILTSLDPELGPVTADSGQLSQVLINLAVNARDAMPQGGTLTIETANVELDEAMAKALFDAQPGPYVRLSVTDTGVGIDAPTKRHLFEPFFTTKDVGAGTGLGLSMVYGIVRQSEGYVTVYSEPGEGAVFNVYLPRAAAPAEHPSETPAKPSRGSERVLLVEDEQVVRELVVQMLERQGYHVTSTGDPARALELATNGTEFDLLLTDVVMPKMHGHQLAEAIVQRGRTPRVLYVSGYTSTSIVERGVLDGDVAFLQKPFALDDLAAKVRETLDKS